MLSNKMTVSLMSLITILALAFVATPAMAGFGVSLSEVQDAAGPTTLMDVSHDDGLQVERPPTTLNAVVKFDKAVILLAASVDVSGYDANGNFLPGVVTTYADATTAATEVTIPITIPAASPGPPVVPAVTKVTLRIMKDIDSADPFNTDKSNELKTDIHLLDANPNAAPALGPDVLKIAMVGEPFATVTTAEFQAHILLSEEPKGGLNKDLIELGELDFGSLTKLASPSTVTIGDAGIVNRPGVTLTVTDAVSTLASWRDGDVHLYLLTVKTKPGEKTALIRVKNFLSKEQPTGAQNQETYVRASDSALVEGRDKLTVKTNTPVTAIKAAGIEVKLLNEGIIPKGGYLVVAKDTGGSAVRNPGDAKKSPVGTARQPFGLTYNLISGGLPNLEAFLANGGTIDLVAPQSGLVISEIMWGTDASLGDTDATKVVNSQYIEIRNTTGADIKMGDGTHKLIFYPAGATLPAASTVKDRVGTVGAGGYWSIAGKGQSGRTGVNEGTADVVAVVPTQALISMQRSISAAGLAADGTMASSWAASVPPGLNFDPNKVGTRVGSPGSAPIAYPTPPAPPTVAPTIPVAGAADIMITEIMVDTGDGRLPQWIELTNVSGAEKSLAGWSLMIENADADADVIGTTVSIDLSGTLGVGGGANAGGTMGKSLLLVGGTARSSDNLSGSARIVDISSEVGQRGRYAFISTMGFEASLIPVQKTGILTPGDVAGNLNAAEAWDIPMDENGRSSLIRREAAGTGTDANGWILASATSLVTGPATWYGSDEDAGTPGYDAGGPLPVELSHFRPARNKDTGQVVITWATQSELNNAGFFIKRSQQRDGQFQVINAVMIPGAGTTSEKQFYTYTDTTAQPNVVYYYQIEDVSLDGNRQTLTNGIRLKGHIGAAGKLTSTWGELKSSNE